MSDLRQSLVLLTKNNQLQSCHLDLEGGKVHHQAPLMTDQQKCHTLGIQI